MTGAKRVFFILVSSMPLVAGANVGEWALELYPLTSAEEEPFYPTFAINSDATQATVGQGQLRGRLVLPDSITYFPVPDYKDDYYEVFDLSGDGRIAVGAYGGPLLWEDHVLQDLDAAWDAFGFYCISSDSQWIGGNEQVGDHWEPVILFRGPDGNLHVDARPVVPAGYHSARVVDVDSAGNAVIFGSYKAEGNWTDRVFRWDRQQGAVELDLPSGLRFNSLNFRLSPDGQWVVGFNDNWGSDPGSQGFVWDSDGQVTVLPVMSENTDYAAYSVSWDAGIIAGFVYYRDTQAGDEYCTVGDAEAVVWFGVDSHPIAVRDLLSQHDQDWVSELALYMARVNADGDVLFGQYINCSTGEAGVYRISRVYDTGDLIVLKDLPGGYTEPGVNWVGTDGSVVGGYATGAGGVYPVIWTAPDYEPMIVPVGSAPSPSQVSAVTDGMQHAFLSGAFVVGAANQEGISRGFLYNLFTKDSVWAPKSQSPQICAVSADGKILYSRAGERLNLVDGTVESLEWPEGWRVEVGGVSAGGTVIWGHRLEGELAIRTHPLVQTGDDPPVLIGLPEGVSNARANDLSSDGSTLVGWLEYSEPTLHYVPFVYRNGSLSTVQLPEAYAGGSAVSVNYDGSMVSVTGHLADSGESVAFVLSDGRYLRTLETYVSEKLFASVGTTRIQRATPPVHGYPYVFAGEFFVGDRESPEQRRLFVYRSRPPFFQVRGPLILGGRRITDQDDVSFEIAATQEIPGETWGWGAWCSSVEAVGDSFWYGLAFGMNDTEVGSTMQIRVQVNGRPVSINGQATLPLELQEHGIRQYMTLSAGEELEVWGHEDLDGDGRNLVMETFCGSDPEQPDASNMLRIQTSDDGQGAELRFFRHTQAASMRFELEGSDDLTNWEPMETQPLSIEATEPTGDTFLYKWDSESALPFVRLRIFAD